MVAEAKGSSGAEPDAVQRWGGRIPIVVGACGHRNIDPSDPRLIAVIEEQCAALSKRYRHSPFLILSSLAEGADRLIAKVAMDKLKADLIAVLPMPADEYENDFQTKESKAEFRDLLTPALHVRTVEVAAGDVWKTPGEPRNVQYARAGAMIADQAQVLLAIWDGKAGRGTGGTADKVAWFERGLIPNEYSLYGRTRSPLDPIEPGLTIYINPANAEVTLRDISFCAKNEREGSISIKSIMYLIDRFNRDVLLHKPDHDKSPSSLADTTDEIECFGIANSVYCASDRISVKFANDTRSTGAKIYFFAFFGAIIFNFIISSPSAVWVYLLTIAVMIFLTIRATLLSKDNRFLEYRNLAEGMRVLFYLRRAGVTKPLWLSYKKPGVVGWIRHAFRNIEFCQDTKLKERLAVDTSWKPEGIKRAKTFWIGNHEGWFASREANHRRRLRFGRRVIGALTILSIAAVMFMASLTLLSGSNGSSLWSEWIATSSYAGYWQAVFGVFTVGGLAQEFFYRRDSLEITKQYASQRQFFEAARESLKRIEDGSERDWTKEEILGKLGEEVLAEQDEWLWFRHTRPFQVPKG